MHPNDGRVVSNFIVQSLLGHDITIYGDGSQTRSFCYVDDLIDGLVRLMGSADNVTGPINIGNPTEFTILELAKQVIEIVGSSSRIVNRPLPADDPRQRRPDVSKAQDVLGWSPCTPLAEGLNRTVVYFGELCVIGHCEPSYPALRSARTHPEHLQRLIHRAVSPTRGITPGPYGTVKCDTPWSGLLEKTMRCS